MSIIEKLIRKWGSADGMSGDVLRYLNGDPAMLTIGNCAVDPTNGSDDAPTATGMVLKTLSEAFRRIGIQQFNGVGQSLTVKILGSTPATDCPVAWVHFDNGAVLTIDGTLGMQALQVGTITAKTDLARATNVPNAITDSALGAAGFWTTVIGRGKRVRMTSGTKAGAIAWPIKDLGTKQARMSTWSIPDQTIATYTEQFSLNPAVADAYVVESLPAIDNIDLDAFATDDFSFIPAVVFKNVTINSRSSRINSNGQGTDRFAFYGCDLGCCVPMGAWVLVNCRLSDGAFPFAVNQNLNIYGGACVGAALSLLNNTCNIDFGLVVQGAHAQILGGNGIICDMGVFDSPDNGLLVLRPDGYQLGAAFVGVPALWGSGNTLFGFRTRGACICQFETFTGMKITGTSGDTGIGAGAGTAKTWAQNPAIISDVAAGAGTTLSGNVLK